MMFKNPYLGLSGLAPTLLSRNFSLWTAAEVEFELKFN